MNYTRCPFEQFQAEGLEVVEIPDVSEVEAAATTRDVLAAGAPVVYQGVLQVDGDPALLGRPDFIVRADLLPRVGLTTERTQGRYEVVDAKLARTAKARAVLQTTFYSACSRTLQGITTAVGCTSRSATASLVIPDCRLRGVRTPDPACSSSLRRRGSR